VYLVASRTRSLSERSSTPEYCRAAPWLVISAAFMRSRSPLTSGGALARRFQSSSTAARHVACLQLLGSTFGAPADVRVTSRTPCFSAATARACRDTARAAISAPASSRRALPEAWKSRAMASSSDFGRSPVKLKSFRSFSDDLSLMRMAALALTMKNRPAMSSTLAARLKSKSIVLSTSTNFASHLVAPHSARSSLCKGVNNSLEGLSL